MGLKEVFTCCSSAKLLPKMLEDAEWWQIHAVVKPGVLEGFLDMLGWLGWGREGFGRFEGLD